MMLLVDAGNSFVKWAQASHGQSLTVQGRCSIERNGLPQHLLSAWRDIPCPEKVVVASVAGNQLADAIRDAADQLWQLQPEFINSQRSFHGLVNDYAEPGRLGVDRLLGMLAAYRELGGPVLVIDCGSAVTVDLVGADGTFLGGVILPGITLACQSLAAGTANIDNCLPDGEIDTLAKTTADGVKAGVLAGLAGGIEKVVSEQLAQSGLTPRIVITGGDADRLANHLRLELISRPDLVLQGLYLAAAESD